MQINISLSTKSHYGWQLQQQNKNIIIGCHSDDEAKVIHQQLEFFGLDAVYLPTFDVGAYDLVSPSIKCLSGRARALSRLANEQHNILVTNTENLLLKVPKPDFFQNKILPMAIGTKIDIKKITDYLIENGFSRVASAIEDGEFAHRGEILDIVMSGVGYRVNFSWGEVENIRQYDVYSQISQGDDLSKLILYPATEFPLNKHSIEHFKKKFITNFGVNHLQSSMYQAVSNGMKSSGYEALGPLLHDEMASIFDYFQEYVIIYDDRSLQNIVQFHDNFLDIYDLRLAANRDKENFYYALKPELLLNDVADVKSKIEQDSNSYITGDIEQDSEYGKMLDKVWQIKAGHSEIFDDWLEHTSKKILLFCNGSAALKRIQGKLVGCKNLIEIEKIAQAHQSKINLVNCQLAQSFITDEHIFITASELLDAKPPKAKKSSKQKLESILTELDNISQGQLVVHRDHGIGQFDKIETVIVDNIAHDCVKILYANEDIFFLPVENIDLLTKYDGEKVQLDRLGHVEWQKRKAKLKNKIRDIAKKLMKITAHRQMTRVSEVIYDKNSYEEFSAKFGYLLTEDQQNAIDDIEHDLTSGHLMDRLICGDVGFGKTEVAMRAAFMAVSDINEDRPQIAIIAPTTILCRQHYNNFVSRFEGNKYSIKQLSRLIKPSEAKIVKEQIAEGKVDIVIGTHALLSSNIKFKNLKMIIIDEEQHFGVLQKEKLKQLKTGIHVLSMSATPIPRTLRMSMVGIKELSLITTPPVDRLAVSTRIMPYDRVVIRDALMREKARGGLSFYVTPKIKEIEKITQQLNSIVPELKYEIAHGQMKPNDIDKIMSRFIDGEFDILLSTTIIESGIDISKANTIIINNADSLGLSQLYQLRGRVGRSKSRGYAYMVYDNSKKLSFNSSRRLEILQNLNTLGAGFSIASHDMDLRGFGNLVGDEQSGNIREVGSELYQEMLDEAIDKLRKDKEEQIAFSPKINLRIPVLIPSDYIEDSTLRLAIYRRSSSLNNLDEIEHFKEEMQDRFGPVPQEFLNLLKTVEIRNKCLELKIESLDTGPNGFVIKFNSNYDVRDCVMKFISQHPRHAQVKAGNKLVYISKLDSGNIIQRTEEFLKVLYEI